MKNAILVMFVTLSFISISANAQLNPAPDVIFDRTNYGGYDISCSGGIAVVNTIISNGNPPYTYIWYNSDTWAVIDTTEDITLPAGRYTLEIYKGTTYSQYDLELTEPDTLNLILDPTVQSGGYNISAYGGNDGYIGSQVQGGNPPYDYLWSNNSNLEFISDLTAGTYSLTITDAGGCTTTQSAILTQPPQPLQVTSITSPARNGYNVSCKGCEDGAINISVAGGAPPYKYTWSNGNMDEDIDTLRARQYKVIVTDDNGETVTRTITLTEPAELNITLTPQVYQVNSVNYNLSCSNCSNGSITAAVTGGVPPYRYLWNTGQTTASISNLSSRDYVLTIIDTNGAKIKEAIFLTAPAQDDWSMNGNANTDSAAHFLGTTDSRPLILKTANIERVHIQKDGKIIFNSPVKMDDLTLTKPLKLDTLKIKRIMAQDGDSIVRIGYGSVNFSYNQIYGTSVCTNFTPPYNCYEGLSIGDGSFSYSTDGFAAGKFARVDLNSWWSTALGAFVKTTATKAIVIGSGGSINSYLTNNIANSVMIGSNSVEPSITILSGTAAIPGLVGIGTKAPNKMLTVNGEIQIDHNATVGGLILNRLSSSTPHSKIKFYQNGNQKWAIGNDFGEVNADNFFFWNQVLQTSVMTISNANGHGAVGIDFDPASLGVNRDNNYKLYVNGSIAALEIKVTAQGFPDYVFEKGYKLRSLKDLESYLILYKHIPGIPSAEDVNKDQGFKVGEMQIRLLEKVEEMTLYIIELQKQIDELKKIIVK